MDPDDPEDAAAIAAAKQAAEARVAALFDKFDADGSGFLDAQGVRLLLESQGLSVTPEYLLGIISAFDKDGNGEFDRDEFAGCVQSLAASAAESDHTVPVISASHT